MGALREPTLLALLVFLPIAACGGKLSLVSGSDAGPSSSVDGANGAPPQGESASSSSGGGMSGRSGGSSSGIASGSGGVNGASSGSFGGSATSGGSAGGVDASSMCTSASDCPVGALCCANGLMSTACHVGPCPASTPLGPIQLCTSTAECLAPGTTCGPLPTAPTLPIMICSAPTDAGLTCSPSTCTMGCCDPNGVCQMGASDTACGRAGAVCVDCTQAGDVCTGRGVCVPPPVTR